MREIQALQAYNTAACHAARWSETRESARRRDRRSGYGLRASRRHGCRALAPVESCAAHPHAVGVAIILQHDETARSRDCEPERPMDASITATLCGRTSLGRALRARRSSHTYALAVASHALAGSSCRSATRLRNFAYHTVPTTSESATVTTKPLTTLTSSQPHSPRGAPTADLARS